MSDAIRKFSKSKGYESIPRELLQSKELSLEAIGLICNLQSYPEGWVLHKTELRKRFKNKEKVVDRIWDELVEYGYIVQFWKRDGRKYAYEYFFNVEKFTVEEIQELCVMANENGMTLYHKGMIRMKREDINYLDFLILSESDKEKLDLSFWDSQNGNLTKDCQINDSWDSRFGIPNLEFPKRQANRLTIKRLTNNKDDDENNINKQLEEKDENGELKNMALELRAQGVSVESVNGILSYFLNGDKVFDASIAKQQLRWMSEEVKNGHGISDFAKYFILGYEKRMESNHGSKALQRESEHGTLPSNIPMHDWLNGEDG